MTTHASHPRRPSRPPAHKPARARIPRLMLPIAAAVLIAAALIVAAVVQSSSSSSSPTASSAGGPSAQVRATTALLRGIPQQGTTLGRADAPVTLVEFADIQCPACRVWEEAALPTIVRQYVRAGKLRVEFRGVSIVGPTSVTALRYAVAAARQGRFWQFLLGAYANQGAENAWVTPDLMQQIGSQYGLDAQQMAKDAGSRATTARIMEWSRDGITSTPTLFVGATGSKRFTQVQLQSLGADGTTPAIEQALAAAR